MPIPFSLGKHRWPALAGRTRTLTCGCGDGWYHVQPVLFFSSDTMSTAPKLSVADYNVIKAHNDLLIEGAQIDIQRIRSVPAKDRPEMLNGMLAYWLDVVKALKWSTAIAAQKARIAINNGTDV